MSYIVDRVGFSKMGDENPGEEELHFMLQTYMNEKYRNWAGIQLVNVVSIEKLYNKPSDLVAGRVSGINVTMVWRTHDELVG